jgi:drug/metabolite transporter (DMT)-like permease
MARITRFAEKVVVVALYLGLNTALNLLNRWALHSSGFSFPLVMTASHMLFAVVMLAPTVRRPHYRQKHTEVMESPVILKGIVVVGIFNGLQIALNNASLMYIELSMNQVIRAFIPVIVALFSVCIEYKVPDRRQALALFCVCIGVVIAVFEESKKRSVSGVLLTVASLILQSAQMSLASKMLQGLQLDSMQITLYTGPVAFCTLTPIALITGEASAAMRFFTFNPMLTCAILLGGSALAVMYNIVLFQTLRLFSAVGAAVLGNAKVIVLLFIAHLVLGELTDWTTNQVIGSVFTFAAAFAYAYVRMFPSTQPADKLSELKTISDKFEMPAKEDEERKQFVVAGSSSFAIDDDDDDDDEEALRKPPPAPAQPAAAESKTDAPPKS